VIHRGIELADGRRASMRCDFTAIAGSGSLVLTCFEGEVSMPWWREARETLMALRGGNDICACRFGNDQKNGEEKIVADVGIVHV
jgi:hypothetical protein